MKFASLLLGSAALVLSAVTATALTATFSGNGGGGFGGNLGSGNLTVSSDTTANTFTFTLNPSGTFSSNAVVIYIDSKAGGFADTSTFSDNSTGSAEAISGAAGTASRTLATFASGFTADFAIAYSANDFTGLYGLATGGNGSQTFIRGNGTSLTLTVPASDLGLASAAVGFTLEGTLISTSAYRSNETIGTSTTIPGSTGDTPNAGFSGTTTYSTFGTFGTPAPEPGTYACVALGAAALIVLNRRRSRRA